MKHTRQDRVRQPSADAVRSFPNHSETELGGEDAKRDTNTSLQLRAIGDVHVPTLVRILTGIEHLPEGATGALRFGSPDEPHGVILIEQNRVCWAVAPFIGLRLTDIILKISAPPISAKALAEVFEVCEQTRSPLGETLVRNGLLTSEQLRAALEIHVAEAMGAFSLFRELSPSWLPNRKRRYDAQFTFSTSEVLVATGALGKEHIAKIAKVALACEVGVDAVGLAFPSNRSSAKLPIAQLRVQNLPVKSIIDIGAWARAYSERGEAAPESYCDVHTAGLNVWCEDDIIYVSGTRSRLVGGILKTAEDADQAQPQRRE